MTAISVWELCDTVKSRFLKPTQERKIGSRNSVAQEGFTTTVTCFSMTMCPIYYYKSGGKLVVLDYSVFLFKVDSFKSIILKYKYHIQLGSWFEPN